MLSKKAWSGLSEFQTSNAPYICSIKTEHEMKEEIVIKTCLNCKVDKMKNIDVHYKTPLICMHCTKINNKYYRNWIEKKR